MLLGCKGGSMCCALWDTSCWSGIAAPGEGTDAASGSAAAGAFRV